MKIDYNSSVNQDIKGQFVQREVRACFSYEMDAILSASQELNLAQQHNFPTFEDIENFYEEVCPKCGSDDIYKVPESDKPSANDDCFECGSCTVLLPNDELESQPQEIFEWWIVEDYLYRKLKLKGEPVLEWGSNCYWGRCTTGQSISLDWVISQICEEMEILDGQKYSWKEK